MSAIWGAINLCGDKIEKKEIDVLKDAYSDCILDKINYVVHDNIYMGCGIQYFTEEAKYEVLPIVDKKNQIYFDADVVLDNREKLLELLGSKKNSKAIPDGTILYELLKKNKKQYLNDILGVYSFVYYDVKNNYLCISTDSMSERCLYYRQIDKIIYFSTLLKPLANLSDKININKKWVADFLALDNLCVNLDVNETLYDGIFKVAPAQVIVWDNLIKKEYTFWKPYENINVKKNITDEECKKKLISIFSESVKCTMRSKDEISILLSGGLDSTSVACFAAQQLDKQYRELHSYTTIPMKGYESIQNKYTLEDESSDVKGTQKYLKNLKSTFYSMDDKNPWKDRKKYLKHLEIPYKSVQNIMWIDDIMNLAYKNGSRIMLIGSYGNCAFSFGDYSVYMNTLLSKGKIVSFFRELKQFQSSYRYSRKQVLKVLVRGYFNKEKLSEAVKDIIGDSYICDKLSEECDCKARLGKIGLELGKSNRTFKNYRKLMCNKILFSQHGETSTKLSLYTGVLQRDPTKDKRLLEFCMSIPIEKFISNGIERRLVNVCLKDFLPDHISNKMQHGVQSADMNYRMQQSWGSVKKEWIKLYNQNMDSAYVDCKKALDNLQKIKSLKEIDSFELIRHIYTLSMLEVIK